jgi:hypothetical protein
MLAIIDIRQVIIDLSTTILAAGIGLAVYRKIDLPYKIIFWQVVLYLGFDTLGIAFSPDNVAVYNFFMPIETALLTASAWLMLRTQYKHWLFTAGYALFIAVYIFTFEAGRFSVKASITEGLILSVFYLLVLFSVLQKRISHQVAVSHTLVSLGMVLYFACSVPFLSTLYYIRDNHPLLGKDLFRYIIILLALLRYLLIAIGFLFAVPRKAGPDYVRT